jgi:hypothetical protein
VLSSISHSTSASSLNPSSKARQAQPARAIQSTVSTNRRVAAS